VPLSEQTERHARKPIAWLSGALAANRVAFGAAYLLAPGRTGCSWIGKLAEREPTRVFTRALGARDLALGVGALRALLRREPAEARNWMAAHAVADGTDLAATMAARKSLPPQGLRFASAMAAASTAIAITGMLRLR
jgi:hypothetical protein